MNRRHWASVYALFRFSNNLRLNLQLPPSTRGMSSRHENGGHLFLITVRLETDYWAALEKEKAASPPNKQWLWSTTPFETAAAAPPPPAQAGAAAAVPARAQGGSSASTSRSATPGSSSRPPAAATNGAAPPPAGARPTTATLPKHWLEAPEVRMPTALRDLVERTIRDSLPDLSTQDVTDDHADTHDSTPAGTGTATPLSAGLGPNEKLVEQEFIAQGFRKGHVARALAYVRSAASTSGSPEPLALPSLRLEVLSHLHLLVPESDLPAAFQSSKPSDTTIRNATARDRDELGRMWRAEEMARAVGVPVDWVVTELDKVRGTGAGEDAHVEADGELEGRLVEVLGRRMMAVEAHTDDAELRAKLGEDALRASWSDPAALELSADARSELDQRREDELVGLEGMLGARFRRRKDGFEIAIPSRGTGDAVALRVLFHPSSRYPTPSDEEAPRPAALPAFYITSPTLPPYIRLHLTYLLATSFVLWSPDSTNGGAWLDLVDGGYGGVVGEMVAFLEENARGVIDNPPDARTVMDRLLPATERPGAKLASAVGQKVTKAANSAGRGGRRGRKLRATPEEQLAIKRSYEALQQTPGYGKMLDQRKRLPAWGMRNQIVDLIRRSRVTIVCGETGSGKTTQGSFAHMFSLDLDRD